MVTVLVLLVHRRIQLMRGPRLLRKRVWVNTEKATGEFQAMLVRRRILLMSGPRMWPKLAWASSSRLVVAALV